MGSVAKPQSAERRLCRRHLMEMVHHKRADLTPLLTHTFTLDQIAEAYKLFGERRDGVMKVAIKP